MKLRVETKNFVTEAAELFTKQCKEHSIPGDVAYAIDTQKAYVFCDDKWNILAPMENNGISNTLLPEDNIHSWIKVNRIIDSGKYETVRMCANIIGIYPITTPVVINFLPDKKEETHEQDITEELRKPYILQIFCPLDLNAKRKVCNFQFKFDVPFSSKVLNSLEKYLEEFFYNLYRLYLQYSFKISPEYVRKIKEEAFSSYIINTLKEFRDSAYNYLYSPIIIISKIDKLFVDIIEFSSDQPDKAWEELKNEWFNSARYSEYVNGYKSLFLKTQFISYLAKRSKINNFSYDTFLKYINSFYLADRSIKFDIDATIIDLADLQNYRDEEGFHQFGSSIAEAEAIDKEKLFEIGKRNAERRYDKSYTWYRINISGLTVYLVDADAGLEVISFKGNEQQLGDLFKTMVYTYSLHSLDTLLDKNPDSIEDTKSSITDLAEDLLSQFIEYDLYSLMKLNNCNHEIDIHNDSKGDETGIKTRVILNDEVVSERRFETFSDAYEAYRKECNPLVMWEYDYKSYKDWARENNVAITVYENTDKYIEYKRIEFLEGHLKNLKSSNEVELRALDEYSNQLPAMINEEGHDIIFVRFFKSIINFFMSIFKRN